MVVLKCIKMAILNCGTHPGPFSSDIGIMSKRNTVGDFIAEKTKPKETQYKAQNWSLKD